MSDIGHATPWTKEQKREVQRLALSGFDSSAVQHLLLQVIDADRTRRFLEALLEMICFGDRDKAGMNSRCAINVGFTWNGLLALELPSQLTDHLKSRSPAYAEGAALRAARYLGDAGESAAEHWDPAFELDRAHVWLAFYGDDHDVIGKTMQDVRSLDGANDGLAGWGLKPCLKGDHLKDHKGVRTHRVHFGFRDDLSKPRIGDGKTEAGDLLLGYANGRKADLWTDSATTLPDVAEFLRNGSFGVLRKIEQLEDRFDEYLEEQVDLLRNPGPHVASKDFLKAKMCGRWPNGAPILQGEYTEPQAPDENRLKLTGFKEDLDGLGCPFGAHIRRTNPRDDKVAPPDVKRVLFRRGMPYGPVWIAGQGGANAERGLLGVFFCACIEDQFEQLISEWVEKVPNGPPHAGRAKDPLAGQHNDPGAAFLIPDSTHKMIELKGFKEPFIRTRGTLYALFPSRTALLSIAQAKLARAPHPPGQPEPAQHVRPPGSGTPAGLTGKGTSARAAQPAQGGAQPPPLFNAPPDRFCDIVMEGGITSGVIYASAVSELANFYRFQSIGGSSIGSFAAALCAAAEHRRRSGSAAGFAVLENLPGVLAGQDEEGGPTRLERCFVPQSRTRRLYRIFLATLERRRKKRPSGRLTRASFAALWQYLWIVLPVLLVLLSLRYFDEANAQGACALWPFLERCELQGPWLALTRAASLISILLGAAVAGVAAGLLWDVSNGLVKNNFGLCRGWSPDANEDSDLAGFLHRSIQTVAGRQFHGAPLCFDDLWTAPGSPTEVHGLPPRPGTRSIDLQIYASNLTHGRPCRFPLEEASDMDRLFFKKKEMEEYFPAEVVAHLVRESPGPYRPRSQDDPPVAADMEDLLELPYGRLPLVVAARLAMSFPLLISAVPLHAIDYRPLRVHDRRFRKCWVSDGGLCSNFPIHLFDSFIPLWPTFGISLHAREEEIDNKPVWLPKLHTSGRADSWCKEPEEDAWSLVRLGSFLISIWMTTWRWNDSTMMRMPGVRDRVVRIYLEGNEGGINIRMPPETILRLGNGYGREAAREFIDKFCGPDAPGWNEHRWLRLNNLMISLRERVRNVGAAIESTRHVLPLSQQIALAGLRGPLRKAGDRTAMPSEEALDASQIKELQGLVDALLMMEDAFSQAGDNQPYLAQPRPSLRTRHPT